MSTHRTFVDLLIRSAAAVLLGIGLALLLNTKSVAGDVYLDEIKTRTDVYQDVTVTGYNETDVYITHSGGMANVKIQDLDPETLWKVGLGPEPGSSEATAAAGEGKFGPSFAQMLESSALPVMESDLEAQVLAMAGGEAGGTVVPQLSPELINQMLPFMIGSLVAGLVLYLFACFCLRLIVKKTGTKPGFMIWLPILQLAPLVRAARMSMAWFWMWISPLLIVLGAVVVTIGMGNSEQGAAIAGILSLALIATSVLQLIASIVWCVKIVEARGKHWIWTVMLLLPVLNLIAFLYLAFSSTEDGPMEDSVPAGKIVVSSAFSEA